MESFTYLIYTHQDYSDILDIHLKRLQKHWPTAPVSLCSNTVAGLRERYPSIAFQGVYEYDDTKPYGERLRMVLSQMKEEYVLLTHEHNILVSDVSDDIIYSILYSMKLNEVDQVRMIVSGIQDPVFPQESPTLTANPGPYFMSVMAAVWLRSSLLDITTKFSDHTYRCFECDSIQEYVSTFRNLYMSSSLDTRLVGESHYLSYYFPVAHVTDRGKWKTDSPINNTFIEAIRDEYSIDLEQRGCCVSLNTPMEK
jgi:hypothetical protein